MARRRCVQETATEEVPYEYYILNVTLTNKTLPAMILPRINEQQREIYTVMQQLSLIHILHKKGDKPLKSLNIHRGEIYFADLDPHSGSEQGGKRPVIAVSYTHLDVYKRQVEIPSSERKYSELKQQYLKWEAENKWNIY